MFDTITNKILIITLTIAITALLAIAGDVIVKNGDMVIGELSANTITTTGNVGVGTTSPGDKLQIQDGGIRLVDTTTDAQYINFYGSDGSTERFNLGMQDDTAMRINAVQPGSYMWFGTANKERIRIDSSGNVGIGTVIPISKLEISGGSLRLPASGFEGAGQIQSTGTVKFANKNGAQGIYAKQISISNSWADNDANTQANGLYVKGNTYLKGNVGIGTDSPGAKLDVSGSVKGSSFFSDSGSFIVTGAETGTKVFALDPKGLYIIRATWASSYNEATKAWYVLTGGGLSRWQGYPTIIEIGHTSTYNPGGLQLSQGQVGYTPTSDRDPAYGKVSLSCIRFAGDDAGRPLYSRCYWSIIRLT